MNFNLSQILVIFLELRSNLASAGSNQAENHLLSGRTKDKILVDVF